jgi:predicted transcriptional regulator
MPRPRAKELTERELEIMHVFWRHGELTAQAVRDHLDDGGRDLAYTTVATLIRILTEKGFLEQTNDQRPFFYKPLQTFDEVSQRIIGDVVERVFLGSRTQLLLQLMEEEELTETERSILQRLLEQERS